MTLWPWSVLTGSATIRGMDLLIGLVMTIGYAVVVGGVLVVLAALTGGLGHEPAEDPFADQRNGSRH
jgi:hypothetical protein